MEIDLHGRKIDLSKAVPLLVADWKALGRQGVTPERLANASADVEAAAAYTAHVLSKADPSVTLDEVDRLTFMQLIGVMQAISESEKAAEPQAPLSPA